MVAGTLNTYPNSFRGVKCRVAAELAGSKLKVVEVNENNKDVHHVPSFQSDDKKVNLIQTNAIAYYVANEQLRGATLEDKANVLQWLEYGSTEVESAVASWAYPALGLVESTAQNVERAKADLKQVFSCVNDFLKTRTYLVGERITLADVALASDLLLAYEHLADEQFRKPYAHINRWFETVINQPAFKKVVPSFTMCAKAVVYDAKKQVAKPAAATAAAAEKVEKKKEPKKEKAEPAAKPKPAPKEEPEEEEEDYAQEPKQNDPFAEMPKGTFIMDEFKRVYSNEDTVTKAIPYLWSKFDSECYSMWYCEYKFPQELALTFMSSNLVGGMFQRIEKLRKNAFGSMCVWGENNNNIIAGIWFWRGQELAFPLCPDWTTDYESYEWRKLNTADENDKKLVNQFLLWEGDLKGKKFADGKIFK